MPESSPPLSVGLLVQDLGMSFLHDQSGAYLIRKNGTRPSCNISQNVRTITPSTSIYKKNITSTTTSSSKLAKRKASKPSVREAKDVDKTVETRGRAKKNVNKWGPIPTTQTHNIFTHFLKCKDCANCILRSHVDRKSVVRA